MKRIFSWHYLIRSLVYLTKKKLNLKTLLDVSIYSNIIIKGAEK